METVAKSDIFFFITTIAVILLSLLFIVVLIYAIRIFRKVDALSKVVHEEGQHIVEDVRDLRMLLKNAGTQFSGILPLAKLFSKNRTKRAKTKNTANSTESDKTENK